jgi:hypothetical protein
MIVKADDNLFYDNPIVMVDGLWWLEYDDGWLQPDKLYVVARPRQSGESRTHPTPVRPPMDVVKEYKLPIRWVAPEGYRVTCNALGNNVVGFEIKWTNDAIMPAAYIKSHQGKFSSLSDPDVRADSFLFCTDEDLKGLRL